MRKSIEWNAPRVFSGKAVPFSAHGDADIGKKHTRHRVGVTKKFIGFDLAPLHTLDIGAPNRTGKELGLKHNSIDVDLNLGLFAPSKDYDLIFCSEIIEHLLCPLGVMRSIYKLLKPGGVCVLSTPRGGFISGVWYQSPQHFTEYRPRCMRALFEYVGFEIVKYRAYSLWDLSFIFYGFRPLSRVLFHRSQLWMLRKP